MIMVNIPKHVDEWTIGVITDLLHQGYDESQTLEFKKSVNQESDRIAKTVCAFANTNGGFLIFGIDADRQKNYHERIVGVQNTDQLKRQIIDKINNLQPHIPSGFLQFKKNNIHLPNDNVIVILQVLRSIMGPHQYEYKFYKRLPDGNESMNADEIKDLVINLQKNSSLFNLMVNELGAVKANYERAKNLLSKNRLQPAITQCELTSTDSIQHFLYHQSYLYPVKLQNLIQDVIAIAQKLSYDVGRVYEDGEGVVDENNSEFKEFLRKNNAKSLEELIKNIVQDMVEILLNDLDQFEKITGHTIPPPRNIVDPRSFKHASAKSEK